MRGVANAIAIMGLVYALATCALLSHRSQGRACDPMAAPNWMHCP